MLIKREVLSQIGLLNDLFFIYYEEYDFCERAKRLGYRIRFIAESRIYHKESITMGKVSAFKTYYMTQNRLLFMRRNVFGLPFWISLMYLLFAAIPKNTLTHLAGRRFDLLKAFYKGLFWHLKPRDITQNPQLRSSATLSHVLT